MPFILNEEISAQLLIRVMNARGVRLLGVELFRVLFVQNDCKSEGLLAGVEIHEGVPLLLEDLRGDEILVPACKFVLLLVINHLLELHSELQ